MKGLLPPALEKIQDCTSFWISVVTTFAWPTLLTMASICYMDILIFYDDTNGGKEEISTFLGKAVDRHIRPGTFSSIPSLEDDPSGCGFWEESSRPSNFHHGRATRVCSLALLNRAYPLRSFDWSINCKEALYAGAQLARKLTGKKVTVYENVGWGKMATSFVGFTVGVVGLAVRPKSAPKGLQSMFIPGATPDLSVFLLAWSVASILGFFTGAMIGLNSDAPTAARATRMASWIVKIIWSALSLACFGVGCWQIDVSRRLRKNVLPMFIYWVPSSTILGAFVNGINVMAILGMAGIVLGIVKGYQSVC